MKKIKIYGAGSIGNHMAYACRTKGWDVHICDIDAAALERTKNTIYPGRYGKFDPEIRLSCVAEATDGVYDLVIIGTPPDSHIPIARDVLNHTAPKVLLIEKPLCTPSLAGMAELAELARSKGTTLCVGYNHVLADAVVELENIVQKDDFGEIQTIEVHFKEHWGGIFVAHPWLTGPQDSYLGFASKGGGACGEHSHAINLWQHLARLFKCGRITEVTASMSMVKTKDVEYDQIANISLKTECNLFGHVVQDVITKPTRKAARVQFTEGFIEVIINYEDDHDAIIWTSKSSKQQLRLIPKKRTDDFRVEADHLAKLLDGPVDNSPIDIERGMDTMMVIAAAYLSHQEKRSVSIDTGYTPTSLTFM